MWEPGIYEWMKEKKKEGKGRNEVEGILELFLKLESVNGPIHSVQSIQSLSINSNWSVNSIWKNIYTIFSIYLIIKT